MKATVRDPAILKDVGLFDVYSYLRATGWTEQPQAGARTTAWVRSMPGGREMEVTLPREPGMKDYAIRLSEVLRTLEEAEERSQLEILRDLSLASADVIRVRHVVSDSESSIPLQDGVLLVQHA